MNHLLDIAICNSLHFKIEENIAYILNSIPNNTFGVFVTVHRDELSNDVNYKDNVHGCIGNWTNNLNTINTTHTNNTQNFHNATTRTTDGGIAPYAPFRNQNFKPYDIKSYLKKVTN